MASGRSKDAAGLGTTHCATPSGADALPLSYKAITMKRMSSGEFYVCTLNDKYMKTGIIIAFANGIDPV